MEIIGMVITFQSVWSWYQTTLRLALTVSELSSTNYYPISIQTQKDRGIDETSYVWKEN